MTTNDGRAPSGQALAVPATPLRVDGPSGFDPSRFDDIAAGARNINNRLEHCVSDEACETVERLENYHDRLAEEVEHLAWLVHRLAEAIATEARRAATGNTDAVHEGAGLKGIAQRTNP